MQIEIPEEKIDEFLQDCFENYPEASGGNCMQCLKWNYQKFEFLFEDTETGKQYTVTKAMAREGLNKLIPDIIHGKIFLQTSANIFDAGEWDAYAVDALVQYSIFGKAIYG